MDEVDPHRLLSMSAFEAASVLRRFRKANAIYTDDQLIETARSSRSDFFPNDYDTGIQLERLIDPATDADDEARFFRSAIECLITNFRPVWMRLAPGGRERVLDAVDTNGAQCFRNAGLLETPPGEEVAKWWDALAHQIRGEIDARLLEQGREAERLSFDYERRRLEALGIAQEPRWIAIEDNGAGYDILSYNRGAGEPTNRLIEVKSSTQNPPRIFLTRGEWDAAVKFGEAYSFHIWSFPEKLLVERTAREIARHIPVDHGAGRWAQVEIVDP